jgi:hypothetical protein
MKSPIPTQAFPEPIRHGRTERIGIVSLEEGLALLKRRKRTTLFGHSINVRGLKFATFLNGPPCCSNPNCGVTFSHFVVERSLGRNKTPAPEHHNFHLNLYGIGSRGEELRFTHDHTLARSLGGADDLSNTTSMCEPCNRKKSVLENELLQQQRVEQGLPPNLNPDLEADPVLQQERAGRFLARMEHVAAHEGLTVAEFKEQCEGMGRLRGKQDYERSAREMAQLLGMSPEGYAYFRRYPFHEIPGLTAEPSVRQPRVVKEVPARLRMKMR